MSQTSLAPLLLETIKIEGGKVENLLYHQKRCDQSRYTLFNATDTLPLSSYIIAPPRGLYRCRVVYAEKIHSIEYLPYTPQEFTSLKIITSPITYDLKYADRAALDTLLTTHSEVDAVIIEQNGFLTDTTIANIAFYDGKQWVTPKKPLLEGTIRAKLLKEGFLKTEDIRKDDLPRYTHVALMNAMLGFKILNHFNIK